MKEPGRDPVNRRDLIKAAGAVSALNLLPPWIASAQESAPASAKVFVTSATRKHEPAAAVAFRPSGNSTSSADTLVLDTSQRFQPILGFGSAYTDASCFLLNSMQPDSRRKFLSETFSPTRMNLSVGRTSIGASDYSRDAYNYDDTAGDLSMANFSIAHDGAYVLPMLREMRRLNPDLFLLSSPWSPPGWMKTYGSMLGGWMTFPVPRPLRTLLQPLPRGLPRGRRADQRRHHTERARNRPGRKHARHLLAAGARNGLHPRSPRSPPQTEKRTRPRSGSSITTTTSGSASAGRCAIPSSASTSPASRGMDTSEHPT